MKKAQKSSKNSLKNPYQGPYIFTLLKNPYQGPYKKALKNAKKPSSKRRYYYFYKNSIPNAHIIYKKALKNEKSSKKAPKTAQKIHTRALIFFNF